MKIMSKDNSFKKSFVRVRIDTVDAEKLLNYLINNKVMIRNVRRNNAFSVELDVLVDDYHYINKGVRKLNGKMKIIDRQGPLYIYLHLKERKVLVIGIVIFGILLYYLSSFIWQIDITTDRYLAPIDVRNILRGYGIDCGTSKKDIDVKEVEEKLTRDIDEVMWLKVRIEGSRLTVEIKERQEPPSIKEKQYTGNIVASKSGVINSIYTSSGTAVVKQGDVVNAGDLLIKGQEGIEGKEYSVKADGRAYAAAFYEEIVEVPKVTIKTERSGKSTSDFGFTIAGHSFYIKKALNNYEKYDKIERKWGFFIKNTYYEKIDEEIETNTEKITEELSNKILLNLDRSAKVLDNKSEVLEETEKYKIRVLVTVEEDIAEPQEAPEVPEVQEENPNS